MDKISVIVPVYNVERYLAKCLDSIISQTHTNLEIICINDGSTDNSGKICDEYAAVDNRIRVFHQENNGLCHARNVGIKNATGKFIGFIDSDDWIEPDMYEVLYSLITKYNVSFSGVNVFYDTDTESKALINREKVSEGVLHRDSLLQYIAKTHDYSGFMHWVWNKLYSVEFLSCNDLIFDESLIHAMDLDFFYRLILSDNCTGAYMDKPLYHYYQHDASLSRIDSLKRNAHRLSVFKKCIDLLDANEYQDISIWVKRQYGHRASLYMETAINNGDANQMLFMKGEMKRYLAEYIKLNRDFPDRIERFNALLNTKIK